MLSVSKKVVALILAVAMTAGLCITAFADDENDAYNVKVVQSEGGTVTASPEGDVAIDTVVTITAEAEDGYEFSGWNCRGVSNLKKRASTSFKMPGKNVTVSAEFTKIEEEAEKYELKVVTEGGGIVSPKSGSFKEGEKVTITAAAKDGFVFYSWYSEDIKLKSDTYYTNEFEMPAKDVTIRAVFAVKQSEEKKTVPVTFQTNGGTQFGTAYVEVGKTLPTLANNPVKEGYVFAGWYTDALCKIPFNFSTPLYSSTILYAKWVEPGTVVDPTDTERFADVRKGDWFYDYVISLADRNIVSGVDERHFSPKGNITRAQLAMILANISGEVMYDTRNPFIDVPAEAWYAKAVTWAYNRGIVTGITSDTFAPDAYITRQDMAAMIVRYVTRVARKVLPGLNALITFNDDAAIAEYARSSVYTLQRAGIISGKPNNMFDPQANATRAEAAKMIHVLLTFVK